MFISLLFRLSCMCRPSWGLILAHLGPLWGPRSASWAPLGALLGLSWTHMGGLEGVFGPCWASLEPHLCPCELILSLSWSPVGLLVLFWLLQGPFWLLQKPFWWFFITSRFNPHQSYYHKSIKIIKNHKSPQKHQQRSFTIEQVWSGGMRVAFE